MTSKAAPDDIIQWPCGAWGFRIELELGHYTHKSDDFEVLSFDSSEWHKFMDAQDYEHH